ncbi:hypothetical protein [Streptomyces monomycini]|uniref:hypothetical protein n=1 Tax=Streptomyces monomycini TaxID=371720 RepID=UPI000B2EBC53|nr:hypothetical protein [Streptomyces monomycini]
MYRESSKLNTSVGLLTVGLVLLVSSFVLPSGFVRGAACGAGVVMALVAAVRMGRGPERAQRQPENSGP